MLHDIGVDLSDLLLTALKPEPEAPREREDRSFEDWASIQSAEHRKPCGRRQTDLLESKIRGLEAALERKTHEADELREKLQAQQKSFHSRLVTSERDSANAIEGLQKTIKVLNERLSSVVHINAVANTRLDPQDEAIRYLKDPGKSRLSDLDIARRVGLSPHRIAILRHRMAEGD
jgi:predicted RNase H-like nuclease (RuvC/YqgF family)